ncbi:UNKNOWN [Stylonychia lemnae]|uniref:Fcf2 pre-rRNA processing C-terminal domain-containing protein n=1 Tax=Stylonychia lemnae TaxID=5949 RepID=A0A077ZV77_STYLE|nr:UNKNOWN [Stylonychia lemnae]|eukprot:CDW73524.1 UNKNOWN [Stylonychia lemnae]
MGKKIIKQKKVVVEESDESDHSEQEDNFDEIDQSDNEQDSDDQQQQQNQKKNKPRELIPESLQSIFKNKQQNTYLIDEEENQPSIFSKTRHLDTKTDSSNIQDEALKKAEALYNKLNIFNNIPANAKQIAPLNNIQLQKKERQKKKEESAGKAWGYMPKQELTEEVKADLKAIQLRNFIYPNRFYKSTDLKKLPKYFQIGTVVADKNEPQNMMLTKKQQKGSIAEQFLKEDSEKMFSKKKYEKVNDRLRRMGEKKRKLKINKQRQKFANKAKGKESSKPGKK